MAISETHGFGNSSYDDVAWAVARPLTDPRFVVADGNAWKPTVVTNADRTVSVSPGWGQACGVSALNASASNVQFAVNSTSFTRTDALVARFDWINQSVTFVAIRDAVVNGSATTVNTNQINRIPARMYDALIAVVKIRPSVGAFIATDAVDSRLWGSGGLLVLPSNEYRSLVDAPPGSLPPVTIRRARRQANNLFANNTQPYGSANSGWILLPSGSTERLVRVSFNVEAYCGITAATAGRIRLYANNTELVPDSDGWGSINNQGDALGSYVRRTSNGHIAWDGVLSGSSQHIWVSVVADPTSQPFWVTAVDGTVTYR